MKSCVVLPLRSAASVQLGRLVLDVKEPQGGYYDPPEPVNTLPPYDSKLFNDTVNDQKAITFAGYLTKLFAASHTSSSGININMKSSRCRTYQMDNSSTWYRKACKDEKTREWLNEQIENASDVFLIVGYQTLFNAKVNVEKDANRQTQGTAEIPVTDAMTHGASTQLTSSKPLDMGVKGASSAKQSHQASLIGVGEQLYAVQFRRVKFDFRKSDTVEASKLAQEHVWLRYKDVRTGGDDEGVDIVGSDLDDDLELEAGLWDQYTPSDTAGESVLYVFDPKD